MKILILACVFIASVTGMSEATAPVRGFYTATYHTHAADIAMVCGIAVNKIL